MTANEADLQAQASPGLTVKIFVRFMRTSFGLGHKSFYTLFPDALEHMN